MRVGSVSTCAAEVLFSSSGCSCVGLLSAFSLRAERLAADVMLAFCHTFRLCSWCHRPRLLDTQTVNEEKGTKTACRVGNAQRTLVPFRFVLCLTFWSVTFFFFFLREAVEESFMLCCNFICRGGVVDSTLEWFDPARRNTQKSPGSGPRMGEFEKWCPAILCLFLLNFFYISL